MNSRKLVHRPRLWRRLAAICYDTLLVVALLMVLTGIVIIARAGTGVEPGEPWFQALLMVGYWLYFAWSWTHGGQTVGMRAWRMRLVGPDGADVTWGQASSRFAAAWLSALVLGLGFWWGGFDREKLCWHDRLSRTELASKPKN